MVHNYSVKNSNRNSEAALVNIASWRVTTILTLETVDDNYSPGEDSATVCSPTFFFFLLDDFKNFTIMFKIDKLL